MNLKNYTSSIPADQTIARIERLLVDVGASGIAKEYQSGVVTALMFRIRMSPEQPEATIKLPANVEACVNAFWKEYCQTRSVRCRRRMQSNSSKQANNQANRPGSPDVGQT